MIKENERIKRAVEKHDRLVLFLDYDGTLADFTESPDIIEPNREVLQLLRALVDCESITPIIVSGRRLAHLQKLIPIPKMVLAGTYGLEIQLSDGEIYYPLKYETIRPALEAVKPIWQDLIEDEAPFFLEDKGWALAIHARLVDEGLAESVLVDARKAAREKLDPAFFQVNAGHKFLEASPIQANKGKCVKFLLKRIPTEKAALIYMGDDDKDEQAFKVVHAYGGFAIRVCSNVINAPLEDWRLKDPKAARKWLWSLTNNFS